ncbi:MAG: glycosyltransferase, partial [Nitrososphaerota archaeon]|nr:glycosyltransferase [Nitrososphaerota archaeon]
ASRVGDMIKDDVNKGFSLVLLAGRFEAGNYKQCELIFPLVDLMKDTVPFKIMILADEGEVAVEQRYRNRLVFLGRVSDAELAYVYKHATCSISLSSWEGFNLNIAESQSFGTPCFAFDVAAHPEVIYDAYFLCTDLAEMGQKVGEYLVKGRTADDSRTTKLDRWIAGFQWANVRKDYVDSILDR